MRVVEYVAAWILVVFIGALAAIILWKIWRGKIDLTKLISEKGGDASMSRFQFLVFTFAVVLMWIYLFFSSGNGKMPPIDNSVLALLGISGASYVVSKGIQKSHETEESKADAQKAQAEAEVKKAELASGQANPPA